MRLAALRIASWVLCFGIGLGILVGSGEPLWPHAVVVAFAITTWLAVWPLCPRRRR